MTFFYGHYLKAKHSAKSKTLVYHDDSSLLIDHLQRAYRIKYPSLYVPNTTTEEEVSMCPEAINSLLDKAYISR